ATGGSEFAPRKFQYSRFGLGERRSGRRGHGWRETARSQGARIRTFQKAGMAARRCGKGTKRIEGVATGHWRCTHPLRRKRIEFLAARIRLKIERIKPRRQRIKAARHR